MASPTLPDSLARIVKRFQRVSSPKQGYEQLIWYAQKLETMPADEQTPENKVSGCTSQVFVTASLVDGKMHYRGDSDSQLVKGLVGLLVTGLNGLTPAEVLQVPADFIQATNLNISLTPSRANGFYNIFQVMQQQALRCQESIQSGSSDSSGSNV